MSTNTTRNKYLRTMRRPDRKWDFFDAQPQATKDWMRDFPINVWPSSFAPHTHSCLADAERRYLASLLSIWGPDHPAVQDAQQRVAVRKNKVVELLTTDDLADFF